MEAGTGLSGPSELDGQACREIRDAAGRLRSAWSRGDLGTILAHEVERYTLFDLQVIGGRLNNEIDRLPSPYREAIRPFFREQVFGKYHTLLSMHRSGVLLRDTAAIRDPELFLKFCTMVPEGCFAWNDECERNTLFRNPKNRLFYYLIAAFSMFVLEGPGHPVGMPFPGGFAVEQRGGDYYCLIRDREKEVFFSICNFCPARQTEE